MKPKLCPECGHPKDSHDNGGGYFLGGCGKMVPSNEGIGVTACDCSTAQRDIK